jgi:branched-chain amino acid transport system substrate-binding protein
MEIDMRRTYLAFAFSAALTGALALASPAAHAQKTFVIGCSLPLSGPEVGFGAPVQKGMQLAVEQFNASKQLPGATFRLDCKDSQDQAQQTVNIAQGFVDDPQVIAALSDFSSTSTMAAAQTYANGKLVEMTPTASSPQIVALNPWMFRSSETIPDYINPLADFAVKSLGKKKIAIMQVQTDWGQGVAKTFTTRAEAAGGSVVTNEIYNPGTTDFRAELTKLRRLAPDVIFLAMLEQDAATFMKQRQQFGLGSIPVVDSGVGLTARSLGLAGSAFDGMWSNRLFNPASKLPEAQSFITTYKAKFGNDPDQWDAYGFDAAMLVMQAAKRAWPDVTRQSIHDQLAKTGTYTGANGVLSIDPDTRELSRTGIAMVRVENGAVNYDPKL